MRRHGIRRAVAGNVGGGYPDGTILAYEFNEVSSPAVDAINGYEATLGATMSIGGGVMSTSNTNAATDTAITDDPSIYLSTGNPRTFECNIDINSGGSIPAIFSIKHSVGGAAVLYASSLAGYREFTLGPIAGIRARFNTTTPYTFKPYHLILIFDGVDVSTLNSYTIFINGVKHLPTSPSGLGIPPDVNSFGFSVSTSNGGIDYDYFRVRNYAVSDEEAIQMYNDR